MKSSWWGRGPPLALFWERVAFPKHKMMKVQKELMGQSHGLALLG